MTRSDMLFVLLIFVVSTVLGASASEEVCQELVANGGFDSNDNQWFLYEYNSCRYDTSGQSMVMSPGDDTQVQECEIRQLFNDPSGITYSSFCSATLCFDILINDLGGDEPLYYDNFSIGGVVVGIVQGHNTMFGDLSRQVPTNGTEPQRICLDDPNTPTITDETFLFVNFGFTASDGVRMEVTVDNVSFKVCTTCPPSGPSVPPGVKGGDPHFVSWTGKSFNYHGGCDTNLVLDDKWLNGKGLRVQIRTKIWSFIKAAAIQIAGDTLEVRGSQEEGSQQYWFNDVYRAADLTMIGGLEITHSVKGKSQFFVIHIGNGQRIVIKSYKEFVRVDFENPTKALYGNTVGILGNFTTGQRLARDGSTVIEDVNEFGQHWQVQPDEPMLFHNVEGPQSSAGQKCELPPTITETRTARRRRRRRLSEPTVTKEDAEKACFGSSEKDDCVFDVLRTGDLDMAGAY